MIRVSTVAENLPKFCLCSDPTWCLRNADEVYRRLAIAYRTAHGAAVPSDAEQPTAEVIIGPDCAAR